MWDLATLNPDDHLRVVGGDDADLLGPHSGLHQPGHVAEDHLCIREIVTTNKQKKLQGTKSMGEFGKEKSELQTLAIPLGLIPLM
jgi:hypothetical protein